MYHITKATFTVIQKQSQQCNPRHLSAETFSIGGQLFDTYRWGSPHQWSLWLQGGPAGTAYILRMQKEKAN